MIKKFKNEDIILLGAGGHAKVVIEAIQKSFSKYNIIGIIEQDGRKIGQKVLGVPIIGTDHMLQDLYDRGLRSSVIALGTVGNPHPRHNLFEYVKKIGYKCINIVHEKSVVTDYIALGEGNVVLAGAIINADTKIGNNCIINTGSIIEHDCIIGSNVHIGPGAKVSGNVNIEDNCMIGIGASIIQGIKIGKNSIVGAGSVVIKDIEPNSIVVGVPAKIIKKR